MRRFNRDITVGLRRKSSGKHVSKIHAKLEIQYFRFSTVRALNHTDDIDPKGSKGRVREESKVNDCRCVHLNGIDV